MLGAEDYLRKPFGRNILLLRISINTVRNLMQRVFEKTGIKSRAQSDKFL